jgi:hypothetical protein
MGELCGIISIKWNYTLMIINLIVETERRKAVQLHQLL